MIADDASGSPQTVVLSGTGIAVVPALSFSPPAPSFPATTQGTSSPPQNFIHHQFWKCAAADFFGFSRGTERLGIQPHQQLHCAPRTSGKLHGLPGFQPACQVTITLGPTSSTGQPLQLQPILFSLTVK
jgi:hypothetical protein